MYKNECKTGYKMLKRRTKTQQKRYFVKIDSAAVSEHGEAKFIKSSLPSRPN